MVGLENPLHIAIILVVVLLVFGAKRLPDMGRSMGEGLRSFKQSVSGDEDSRGSVTQAIEQARDEHAAPTPATTQAQAATPAEREATPVA